MPLLKIERRTKPAPESIQREGGGARSRGDASGAAAASNPSPVPALVTGAVAALALLGGISAFILTRQPPAAGSHGGSPAPTLDVAAAESGLSAPAAGSSAPSGGVGVTGPDAQPDLGHVPALNPHYGREAVIATVNGEPYTMAQLEASVRVARALATLSGDPVPNLDDAAGMREFQIGLLRRQIDVILIRQAAAADGAIPPTTDGDVAVDALLQAVGAAPQMLDNALASNGATQAHLDTWFRNAELVDFYIQTQIMAGQDPSLRADVVKAWLDQRWAASAIAIDFYVPEDGS